MQSGPQCEFSDIVVTPERLDFEVKEGFKFVPPMQDLFLKKSTGAGLGASYDIVLGLVGAPPQFWLSTRPQTGKIPKRVRVGCKSVGMKAGKYEGSITIYSHVKVTPPVIPVTLTVKGEEPPPPQAQGTIEVAATLDGKPWSSTMEYTLSEPVTGSLIRGSSVPNSHTVDCSIWTCAHVRGGPAGADFDKIIPTPVRSVANGETIRFTLLFLTPPPPPVFVCPNCGAEFKTEGELQQHIEQDHRPPPDNWLRRLWEIIKRWWARND